MQSLIVCMIFASVCIINLGGNTQAQDASEQPCGGYEAASAFIKVPAGRYDFFAKFNEEKTETANLFTVKLNNGLESGACLQAGASQVTGDSFVKVAESVHMNGEVAQLYFASATTKNFPTATAPQIILVPSGSNICNLEMGCIVDYEGQQMNLSPRKLSLTSDSLVAGILSPVENEKIDKVVYSVDGKPAYETENLEPFNERYVSGGTHTLVRRIVFSSGATLSDSSVLEHGTFADVNYLIQSTFFGQSKLLSLIAKIIALCAIWLLLKMLIRATVKRWIWKRTHTAGKGYKINEKKTGAQKHFFDESFARTLFRYRKLWVGAVFLAVTALIFVTFIVGFFTVDGVSMYPTLKDRSVRPLVRLQKTIASINRTEIVPDRGDIVVIQKDESNLFEADVILPKTYVVKRTVALPGDRITISKGKIMVYDDENKDGFDPDSTFNWISDTSGSEEFSIDITLKDSEIFVMGDNRGDSVDSRFYGPVNVKDVIGKVIP